LGLFGLPRASDVFAMSDIDHLLCDDPGAREFELAHGMAGNAAKWLAHGGKFAREMALRDIAVVLGLDRPALVSLDAAVRLDPRLAQRGEPAPHVDLDGRIAIRARGVVHAERGTVRERDLARRHSNVIMALWRGKDLAAARQRARGHLRRG